jgi:putative ABC transport system ATP-binding protein
VAALQDLIVTQGLTKIYTMGDNKIHALSDVSITIRAGEFAAFVGPSGSGKSTLMNLLGCLDTPTSGSYFLGGRDIGKARSNELAHIRNRRIGFVFQGFNLLPSATALENTELPGVYNGMGMRARRRKALDILERLGLADRIHHRPHQLSGGQQQRVAIARALMTDPDIIMADEPTGNLDSATGHEILELLRSLNEGGRTILLITHNQDIASYAGRILSLIDGRIVSDTGEGSAAS